MHTATRGLCLLYRNGGCCRAGDVADAVCLCEEGQCSPSEPTLVQMSRSPSCRHPLHPPCVGGVSARVHCSDLTAVHSLFKIQSRQFFFFFFLNLPHLNLFSCCPHHHLHCSTLCCNVLTYRWPLSYSQGYTFLHHKEEHCEATDFLS